MANRDVSLRWFVCATPAAVALWLGLGVWPYTVDDSFISLRYAWNLAHGVGLVFNPGEAVEGFSNPTWVLALAPFLAMGFDGEVVAKIAGLACHVVVAALVAWASLRVGDRADPSNERLPARAAVALAAGGFAAWSVPSVNWALLALETPFYTALLFSSFAALLHPHPRAPLVGAALAGLAGISRPEGALQAAMLGLALLVLHAGTWRPSALWATGSRAAPLVVVPVLGWATFRWFYFADIVPNTWYHKGGAAEWPEVRQYLEPLLTNESVLFATAIAGLGLLWAFERRVAGALSLVLLGHALFVCRVGGDWMPNQRFAAPALPFIAFAAGAGLSAVVARAPSRMAQLSLVAATLVLAGLHGAQALPDRMLQGDGSGGIAVTPRTERDTPGVALRRGLAGSNSVVTVWVLERARDGQTLAYSEVGLVAYVSELRVIDLVGLTDKFMAGATGLDTDGRVAWLQAQCPEWLLLRTGGVPAIRKLRSSSWLTEQYDVIAGPKSYLAARRKDVRPATVAEALASFERAAARQPRFAAFSQERDALRARVAAGQGGVPAASDDTPQLSASAAD